MQSDRQRLRKTDRSPHHVLLTMARCIVSEVLAKEQLRSGHDVLPQTYSVWRRSPRREISREARAIRINEVVMAQVVCVCLVTGAEQIRERSVRHPKRGALCAH